MHRHAGLEIARRSRSPMVCVWVKGCMCLARQFLLSEGISGRRRRYALTGIVIDPSAFDSRSSTMKRIILTFASTFKS